MLLERVKFLEEAIKVAIEEVIEEAELIKEGADATKAADAIVLMMKGLQESLESSDEENAFEESEEADEKIVTLSLVEDSEIETEAISGIFKSVLPLRGTPTGTEEDKMFMVEKKKKSKSKEEKSYTEIFKELKKILSEDKR